MVKILGIYKDTPIGKIVIEECDGKIVRLFLKGEFTDSSEKRETPILNKASQQLDEYFAGIRKKFSLPLLPAGTPFQKKIWEELMKIPYGEIASYGQIAEAAGNPKAARAVGNASNKNPILIIIPCHRVAGKNGNLVGYRCGIEIKKILLDLESKK